MAWKRELFVQSCRVMVVFGAISAFACDSGSEVKPVGRVPCLRDLDFREANRAACERSEAVLNEVLADCELPEQNLRCDEWRDRHEDCQAVWDELAESASCVDGELKTRSSASCACYADRGQNVSACVEAEGRLKALAHECGEEGPDLMCSTLSFANRDCTRNFAISADEARCEGGVFSWEPIDCRDFLPGYAGWNFRNVEACLEAQAAVDEAYVECEIALPGTDLRCDSAAIGGDDCTERYKAIALSAACTDGSVDWDGQVRCVQQ